MFNLAKDLIEEYWQGKKEKSKEIKKKPADKFQKFCNDEPWAAECKIFDV